MGQALDGVANGGGAGAWRWSPELGRWTREYPLPDLPGLVELSANAGPGRDPYDFWREMVFYDFDADPLGGEAARTFSAGGMAAVSNAAQLRSWRSDAMTGRRTRTHIEQDGGDNVSIGLVVSGERRAEEADGETLLARAGEAFVYDAARTSRLGWSGHEGLHLTLARPVLMRVFGADLPSVAELTRLVNASPMLPLLREQMVAAARTIPSLAVPERAFALEQAMRLASFLLLRAAAVRPDDPGAARADVYATALQQIERHMASPGLSPAALAARLGCSRSTLYRAFADRGETVAEAIQRIRFERARLELLASGPEIPVSEVALRCGLFDPVNFSARFRRRFGYSPTELRAPSTAGRRAVSGPTSGNAH